MLTERIVIMAFCRYCGRELAEGESCDCRTSITEQEMSGVSPNPEQQTTQTDNQSLNFNQSINKNTYSSMQNKSNNTIDFTSVIEFFKNYVKSPKNAAKTACDNNDWLSLIICSFGLLFSMIISQFSIWALTHVFSGYYFLFGFLFALFSVVLPFGSNLAVAFINKLEFSPKEHLFKTVLRTPIWSATLILIAISGAFGLKLFFIAIILSLIVYSVSQLSVLLEIFENRRKDLLVMGISSTVFIFCAYILILLEFKAAGKVIVSTISELIWYLL